MDQERMQRNNGFTLDAELEHRIESYARATKSTPGDVVRKAFEEYEATHNGGQNQEGREVNGETLYDRWSQLGFIGCIDDPNLPSDLSTNPKYMEGFGRD